MTEPITFSKAPSLRKRFRAALPDCDALDVVTSNAGFATIGQALYIAYRQERTRQNFEEWEWKSLDVGQRLVWERLAQICKDNGLKI